jgi:hypothetical protein
MLFRGRLLVQFDKTFDGIVQFSGLLTRASDQRQNNVPKPGVDFVDDS